MSGDDVAALLRQVERAGLFTHSALGRGHLRQRELESFVYGLIDVLLAHGVIEEDELRAAVQAVRDEMDASGEPPEPGVVLRVDESKVEEMGPQVKKWISRLGTFGHLARMVVFGLVGIFVVKAAIDYKPSKAVGLDGALAKIVHHSYGPFLLGIVATGLIAFAVYSLSDARYRRI